ncbi:MAG: hypothetical protein ACERKV_00485 [Clostridiaceae bacterium]
MYDLYIVTTQTGSLLSRTIKFYTRAPYNHVSIGFDEKLESIYSFGRRTPRNPMNGGFVKEAKNEGVYKIFKQTTCRVYKIEISDLEYKEIKKEINKFCKHKDKYKYNFLGLVAIKFGIKLKRENKFYCTEFVGTVLSDSKVVNFDKEAALLTPYDFYKIERAKLVYEGKFSDYLPLNLVTI